MYSTLEIVGHSNEIKNIFDTERKYKIYISLKTLLHDNMFIRAGP